MKTSKLDARNIALDIIRCVALFLVIAIHFFLNSGFYGRPMIGSNMFIMNAVRTASSVCVPLFLLLTGYLMSKKILSKNYYKGILKIIVTFVLASICCLIYKHIFLNDPISIKLIVGRTLNFTGANYSWYIEMYIGLFLLIPFLNIMYNGLKDQKQKITLIVTFLILTTLPSILNIFNLTVANWWNNPTISDTFSKLVPSWWTMIYPVTYYFIGCYLKEFDIKIKKIFNIFIFIICMFAFATFNYYRSYGELFKYGLYNDWGGFECVILSTLLFIFLSHINTNKLPKQIKYVFYKVSELSLGAYLVSYIFDSYVYQKIIMYSSTMNLKFAYFFIVVPIIFICSVTLSFIISLITKGILLIVDRFIKKKLCNALL